MKQSIHIRAMTRPFYLLRVFSILSVAMILAGCLSRPSMKVQIRTLQIAPPFDGHSLVYRTGDFSYKRELYAQFLSPPAEELAVSIGGILVKDGGFSAVVGTESAARPETLAEIYVSELSGDMRKPGTPCAVLALQVIMLDATNGLAGKVILQQDYSRRIPVKAATPNAFMEGWNEALIQIFAQVAADFRGLDKPRTGRPRNAGCAPAGIRPAVPAEFRTERLRGTPLN